jgi:hypothetical protein
MNTEAIASRIVNFFMKDILDAKHETQDKCDVLCLAFHILCLKKKII